MSHLVADDALGWTRSMLQTRLLSELFADRLEAFVLKGGMAMRLRHQHARATQDIDLDSDQNMSLSTMQNLVRRAIRRALSFGVLENIEITEPKQTDTTARWRIRGFDSKSKQNISLTVEVSRRDKINEEDFQDIDYGLGTIQTERPIRVYTNQLLAFKKVKALLADNREAPRDVSDLYLLICAHVEPPINQLREWLKDKNEQTVLNQLWNKIDSMDEARFKAEVLPSLPIGEQSHQLYKNWDHVRLEVGTQVERWIKEAQAYEEQNIKIEDVQDIQLQPLSVQNIHPVVEDNHKRAAHL